MRLFIAEKPSLGRSVAAGISGKQQAGDGFIRIGDDVVTWAFGHILELAPPQAYNPDFKSWKQSHLPICPDKFKLLVKKDAKKQFDVIKGLLKQASEVVNAGDPDREGQLLIDEILEFCGWNGKTSRICFEGYDEKNTRKAFANIRPNSEFTGWRDCARARSWSDWVVGLNGTRALTLFGRSYGADGVLSCGRVQSPTLGIVVRRDLEIENFVPTDHAIIRGTMAHQVGNLLCTLQLDPTMPGMNSAGLLTDMGVAEKLAKEAEGKDGVVMDVKREKKKTPPPMPFDLAALQKAANKMYKMSAQETLNVLQGIYEKKFVTYPRTDNRYLPEEQHADAPEILSMLKGYGLDAAKATDPSLKSKAWDTSKVAAHHGIIPTGVKPSLSGADKNIYDLVAVQYCLQFLPPKEYESQSVTIKLADRLWVCKGTKVLNPGWTAAGGEEDTGEAADVIPEGINKGDSVKCIKTEIVRKKTTPPPRYTEGSLIEAMKNPHLTVSDPDERDKIAKVLRNLGIGTGATRANIIETLKKREYIKIDKKSSIISTELGRQVYNLLPEVLKNPITTAQWEENFEKVEEGKMSLMDFYQAQVKALPGLLDAIFGQKFEKSLSGGKVHMCPTCGKPLRKVKSKKTGKLFWSCSGYPECSFITNDQKGSPFLAPKCPVCGEPMRLGKNDKGDYLACFNKEKHPDDKPVFTGLDGKIQEKKPLPKAKGEYKCQECGQPLKYIKTKKGDMMFICFNSEEHKSGKPVFVRDVDGKPEGYDE